MSHSSRRSSQPDSINDIRSGAALLAYLSGILAAIRVGLTPSSVGLPGQITDEVAAECVRALKGHATSVALSVSSDLDEIAAMVRVVQPDIVHLCAEPGAVSPADVETLRTMLGDIQIMQAIAMTGPEAVDVARSYESVSDYLILDSVTTDVQGIGPPAPHMTGRSVRRSSRPWTFL